MITINHIHLTMDFPNLFVDSRITITIKSFLRWLNRIFDLFPAVPEGFFSATRGLRQGDPLFPFLFTFVVDAFIQILSTEEEQTSSKVFGFGKS